MNVAYLKVTCGLRFLFSVSVSFFVEPWSRWARTGNGGYNSHRLHQNWTIEHWKNIAWSDESRFLLRHSDGRVRIWRKEHEIMDPSSLVSTVQAAGGGGLMVWAIFYWHTLGPIVPIWALFKRHSLPEYCWWPYLSLYDYSVPIFWWLLPAR